MEEISSEISNKYAILIDSENVSANILRVYLMSCQGSAQ